MATLYKSSSNLRATAINQKYLDIYEPPFTPNFARSSVITLEQRHNHRPDLLAHELYGDAKLWWVFTLYNRNDLVDPIYDFVTGLSINIPHKDTISGY